jgi:hypothetical protein
LCRRTFAPRRIACATDFPRFAIDGALRDKLRKSEALFAGVAPLRRNYNVSRQLRAAAANLAKVMDTSDDRDGQRRR